MSYFSSDDVVILKATVTSQTKGGSMFANTPDRQAIFIRPQIVEAIGLQVGDAVTVSCIDNTKIVQDGPQRSHSARWKALSVSIDARPSARAEAALSEKYASFLSRRMAWTVEEFAAGVNEDAEEVAKGLQAAAKHGLIAYATVCVENPDERCETVFYAGEASTLIDLLDGYELEG